jgi:hypothetical protein
MLGFQSLEARKGTFSPMLNNLFEFFFCPIHGIFRPDNIVIFMAWAGSGQEVLRVYASKLKGWFL